MRIAVEALKTCTVSCVDLKQIKHTVEVSAAASMRRSPRPCDLFPTMNGSRRSGTVRPILVKEKSPEIEHTIRVQEFERWLEASSRSPAEMIVKNRLPELLAKGDDIVRSIHYAAARSERVGGHARRT